MSAQIHAAMAARLLPPRPPNAHKGTYGHVFVLAGSRGFTGAAKLTAMAAARSGTGLVTLGIPDMLADVFAAALIEVMSCPLPSTTAGSLSKNAVEPALEFCAGKQAVVLGPGLSQHPDTIAFVTDFVRRSTLPLVIDADGLNALATDPSAWAQARGRTVVTPHPGEMARLLGTTTAGVQAHRENTAATFAARHDCVVVLKGHRTVIAAPNGDVFVNPTGNEGMATGGTGDVLAGLVGGLIAQGAEPINAAILGTYAHGLAGDLAAAAKTPRGMIASDVIAAIPDAWRAIETAAETRT